MNWNLLVLILGLAMALAVGMITLGTENFLFRLQTELRYLTQGFGSDLPAWGIGVGAALVGIVIAWHRGRA